MASTLARVSQPNEKLQRATKAINDITHALSSTEFARKATTPDLFYDPTCQCCAEDDCATLMAWDNDRTQLVDRLGLSAEIGQALLERHEAYVSDQSALLTNAQDRINLLERSNDQAVARMAELVRSQTASDARLAQARLNLDVAEGSNRTLLREVQDSRNAVARLSARLAKTVGWEDRLNVALQERNDLAQERDALFGRTRSIETKLNNVTAKCASLQAEVNRLNDDLQNQSFLPSPQMELSEELLRDARARLDMLHHSLQHDHPSQSGENPEITRLLENLVADNEAMKRDNAELQNMLAESRTEIHALSGEVVELRAAGGVSAAHPVDVVLKSSSPPQVSSIHNNFSHVRRGSHLSRLSIGGASTTSRRGEGWASASFASSQLNSPPPYQIGFSRTTSPRMLLSALEPDSERVHRDRSPGERSAASPNFTRSPSPDALESAAEAVVEETTVVGGNLSSPPKVRKRPLVLLARSRGVQTDFDFDPPNQFQPRNIPSTSSVTGLDHSHSETSSAFDPFSSTSFPPISMSSASAPLPELVERLSALLNRLTQADVATLSARLKRQNLLAGSDVGHLSRSTISTILADVSGLRTHFRAALEVERQLEMTRKDLRGLFRLARDMFEELGRLRITVNDVTLDPASAARIVSHTADPPTATTSNEQTTLKNTGWIAPITKLFAPATSETIGATSTTRDKGISGSPSQATKKRPPIRSAPKLAAAVSSSSTTVNVEFAASRTRRAVSSTVTATAGEASGSESSGAHGTTADLRKKPRHNDLLGIFAGAPPPKPVLTPDAWVVVPDRAIRKTLRSSTSTAVLGSSTSSSTANIGGMASSRKHRHRMSRNVDALVENRTQRHGIIGEEDERGADTNDEDDDGNHDFQKTLLERSRTLRRGGLSDSSIHSTFLAAGDNIGRLLTPGNLALSSSAVTIPDTIAGSFGAFDRASVLRSLSQKMQNIAGSYYAASSPTPTAGDTVAEPSVITSSPNAPPNPSPPRPIHGRSGPTPPIRRDGESTSALSPGRLPTISNLMAGLIPSASEHSGSESSPRIRDRTFVKHGVMRDRW